MAKKFSKFLGKVALMTAAALWAGCNDSDKKADDTVTQKNIKAEQQQVVRQNKKVIVESKYLPVRDSSITSETISGVTALYGTRSMLDPQLDEDRRMGDSILAGLLYGSGGGVMAETKGEVQVPQESDIVIENGQDLDVHYVLKTVRQRTYGLSHVYRKYLRKKLHFEGTVVLKLKVDEMGNVENIVLDSSTTGYEEFDEDIRRAVNRWIFEKKKVRGTFKIPFKFYEKN
jgi:TonB family protein